MISSGPPNGTKKAQRLVGSDPQLALALCLLELERDTGATAEQLNETVRQARAEALAQGVPEDELEDFLAFHLRSQLART
jgi:hypothetical protein